MKVHQNMYDKIHSDAPSFFCTNVRNNASAIAVSSPSEQ